ncbi:MAG: hypothetical protein LBP59_04565 [Planctomycetaceae bacterium]|nr:hypothetical protein [Planctomycetaceae bacterium]
MSEFLLSTAFLFAYRQSAGGTPAIRWSAVRFKNDPQITQIRKIILGTSGTGGTRGTVLICNFEIRIFNSELRMSHQICCR